MLEARLLGQFDLRLDGQPVALPSRPAQALLSYLLLHAGLSIRREKLAGVLWPDATEENARGYLRQALWRVRRAIEAGSPDRSPYLLADDVTVTFSTAVPYSLDAEALSRLMPDRCSSAELMEVVSLYRGELLPGFYDDWVTFERDRLAAQFDSAMQALLDRLGEEQRWTDIVTWAERWIALGHVPEPAYRALMHAHARLGDLASMASAYQRCRDALHRDLDVEPSPKTLALYEALTRSMGSSADVPMQTHEAAAAWANDPAPGEPPFKGLYAFDEADAGLFFGRETVVARLVERLRRDSSLLVVVGASGSGKSSIVRAGLIVALRGQRTNGHPRELAFSRVHVITPTAHPLEAVALSLTSGASSLMTTAQLVDDLAQGPRSLRLAVNRLLASQESAASLPGLEQTASAPARSLAPVRTGRLLLVVDEFEELFTLCHDETERRAFVENLLNAADPRGPLTIVASLRADFYGHCAQYPALREALATHQEYIGSMSLAELRRAIEEPAARGNWTFEPGLVDLILRDVGDEPGALPLLSHALLETWQRRAGRQLTLAGYDAAGGVRGAIARTAEHIYQDLQPDQRKIARTIFLRLTELGEGTQDTRRRVALSELTAHLDADGSISTVLELLAKARLITLGPESVEVAHEALIREWPTLRQWLAEDRASLRLHRHLTVAALEWARLGQDQSELYRGARLTAAWEWVKDHPEVPNALESAFLAASHAEAEREVAESEALRQRELDAARRLAEAEAQQAAEQRRAAAQLRRRAVYLTVALGLALSLAVTALYFVAQSRSAEAAAQRQRRVAQARELAAAAMSNLSADPERSVLLAMQAVSTTYTVDGTVTPQAENALHEAVSASRLVLTLHLGYQPGGVLAAHFSPDGRRVVTAGPGDQAAIWDAATGRALFTLTHGGAATSASFSPNGQQVVTAGDDQKVRTWDAVDGRALLVLAGHSGSVTKAVFSPDGQRLASASVDGTGRVWDAVSGRLDATLSGHVGAVRDIAFSPDGKQIVTGGDDTTIRIWDASTGAELMKLRKHTGAVFGVSYDPLGIRIASVSADGTAKIWNATNGRDQVIFANHRDQVRSVAFSRDGQRAATSSSDSTARVWDVSTGRELFTLAGHGRVVHSVAFSQDGMRLVTAGEDQSVRIWDATPSHELAALQAHSDRVWDIAFSPDGARLATIGFDGFVRVWEVTTGRMLLDRWANDASRWAFSVSFSPDGARLITAGDEGWVGFVDIATTAELRRFTVHPAHLRPEGFDGVLDARYSPDGQQIATAGADNTAALWDARSATKILTLQGHTGRVNAIRFSPDGTRLATASEDHTAKIWDAASGREVLTLAGHAGGVESLAFSPDGKRLATSSTDATARVWELASGRTVLTLAGHTSAVQRVAFSPDGTRLATVGNDATARFWDATSGQELLTLSVGNPALASIAFSPDGAHLAVGGADGAVRFYLLRLPDLLALAKTRVTRTLTPDECRAYLHTASCPRSLQHSGG